MAATAEVVRDYWRLPPEKQNELRKVTATYPNYGYGDYHVQGEIAYEDGHECSCEYCDRKDGDGGTLRVDIHVDADDPVAAIEIAAEKCLDEEVWGTVLSWRWVGTPAATFRGGVGVPA